MRNIRISFIAGALLATAGAAYAQPAERGRGPAAEITRDQAIARAEQRFARLDANKDGSITREEMRAGRQQMRAERQQRLQQRLAGLPAEERARVAQRMDQRAARRAEHRARIEAMSPEQRAQHRAQRQAARGGRGGRFAAGGTVTLAEFRARALQRFERLDADRDGRVTMAERRQVRQQLRQERRARPGSRD